MGIGDYRLLSLRVVLVPGKVATTLLQVFLR